ncbi:MAG: cupin domain-containing protein [Candidatus Dormibacteria bacterium]
MTGTARSFTDPATTTPFNHGHEDVVELFGTKIGLAVFEPGWRWSNDVRPLVGADHCPIFHVGYMLSGELHIDYPDGSTLDVKAGDVVAIPPGHDSWVVGDEAVRLLDWGGKGHDYPAATASGVEAAR